MAFPTNWKKHKISIDISGLSLSGDVSNYPYLLTEDAFLADAFSNSQGKEINSNYLLDDANLQGYWRLEDTNYTDSSSNGYDLAGTTRGAVAGKFENGVDFEKDSADYISIAHASCANLAMTGSRTFSLWAKPESIGTGVATFLSKRGVSNSYRGYSLRTDNNTKKVQFKIVGLTTNEQVSSSYDIETGSWYHIVGVYDSANTKLKVWLNGVKTEVTASGSSIDSGVPFAIGSVYMGVGDTLDTASTFDGIIDDVAVWDRALTDAEVRTLYTGGADLRFSTDSAGSTQIPHEVVNWDIDNSKAEVWAKIPTVDYDESFNIYVWYDNSSAEPLARDNTYGSDNVWNSNYLRVYHGNETDLLDSTSNNITATAETNEGTENQSIVTGKVGKAISMDGVDDYNDAGNAADLGVDNLTWTAWLKTDTVGDMPMYHGISSNRRGLYIDGNQDLRFSIAAGGTVDDVTGGDKSLCDDNWHHAVATYDGTTMKTYVDGAIDINQDHSVGGVLNDPAAFWGIGCYSASKNFNWTGELDEIRYMNTAVTADWAKLDYNTQNTPATYVTPKKIYFIPKVAFIT